MPEGTRPAPRLIEPRIEREREVLRLNADGLYNTEIAGRLVIATRTVKSHANHIHGKINVQSRNQAAARARKLRLLQLRGSTPVLVAVTLRL